MMEWGDDGMVGCFSPFSHPPCIAAVGTTALQAVTTAEPGDQAAHPYNPWSTSWTTITPPASCIRYPPSPIRSQLPPATRDPRPLAPVPALPDQVPRSDVNRWTSCSAQAIACLASWSLYASDGTPPGNPSG